MIEEEKGQEGWQVDEEMMKVFVNTESWSLGRSTGIRNFVRLT